MFFGRSGPAPVSTKRGQGHIDSGAAHSVADLVRAEGRHAWPVLIDLCDDQQVEAPVAKAEALGGPTFL